MSVFPRTVDDKAIEHPGRYQLTLVAGTTDTYDFIAVPGIVTEEGTAVNKTYLQPIENELANLDAIASVYAYKNLGGGL